MDDVGWQWMKRDDNCFVTGGVGQGGHDQEGSDYSIASDVFAEAMNFCKE